MAELEYVTIEGFKSIRSIHRLAIRPVNILIGANGSGKSNFIEAFEFARWIGDRKLNDYVASSGGADNVLHFGSKTTTKLELHFVFRNSADDVILTLAPAAGDALYAAGGVTLAGWVWQQRSAPWRIHHLHDTSASSPMRKTADVDDNRFLRPDGGNLAAFLLLLKERWPTEYRMIERTVRQVAPFLAELRLEPLERNPDTIKLEWCHKDSDQYFDASSLSDGTLRFIALATLLLQPQKYRPSVILIDEPELGLHPYAIQLLASLIRQASVKSQVIVSTQSSLLVDSFEPEDVLVAERVRGGTEFKRLSRDGLATWLEDYSLGQLWEKNEIGGRPAPE